MSIAWTTILIIALILPGVFFFMGYSTRERYSRQILNSTAVGEVGVAIFISLCLHIAGWTLLWLFGFDLASFVRPFANYDHLPHWLVVNLVIDKIFPVALYVVCMALVGYLLGCLIAWGIVSGFLRFLAKHKWNYEVIRSMRTGVVTAYVMTTTSENDRVLMYKGILSEFYLTLDGTVSYVVLQNCSRYYMKFDGDAPTTTGKHDLFGPTQADRKFWDYLLIDGENIANILFDPSPKIIETNEGQEALDKALASLEAAIVAATEQARSDLSRRNTTR